MSYQCEKPSIMAMCNFISNNDKYDELDEEFKDDFAYYCEFCNKEIDLDTTSSCEHAIYHFATVGYVITFEDSLRFLLYSIMLKESNIGELGREQLINNLENIGIIIENKQEPILSNIDNINGWESVKLIEKYSKEICNVIPSFNVFFCGTEGGFEGTVGNYFGIANNRDINSLKSKYHFD